MAVRRSAVPILVTLVALAAVHTAVPASAQIINTVAGTGSASYNGDEIVATGANIGASHVAVDASGDLYIADASNSRIRKVDYVTGIISTVAGNGTSVFSGDGGPAIAAGLSEARSVGVDANGDIYIGGGHRVRKVDHATGIISTVAGTGNTGYSGTGGPATSANLHDLRDIAVNAAGDVFTGENACMCVRKVDYLTGIISLVAGIPGSGGNSGDGGPATSALFNGINNLTVDTDGNLFISDRDNNNVRRVDAVTGIITNAAGIGGAGGFSGDGSPATTAQLSAPQGVAVDADGNLFLADNFNARIRRVDAVTGIITTVAGTGTPGFFGDGGPGLSAQFNNPVGLAVDADGILYIADAFNFRIRRLGDVVPPSPVTVSAPDVQATYNQVLTIPISISEASGIVSVEVTVEYDTDLLAFVDVDATGTLTDPGPPDEWAVEFNTEPGSGTLERVRIAAAVSQSAATGQYTLVNVNFTVRDQPRVPDSSPLTLLNVLLNDGTPSNTTVDGSVTLVGNAGTITSLPPTFYPREDLTVTVVDLDEDTDGLPGTVTDVVSVTATNLNNFDVISLTLPEDAVTAGTFVLVVLATRWSWVRPVAAAPRSCSLTAPTMAVTRCNSPPKSWRTRHPRSSPPGRHWCHARRTQRSSNGLRTNPPTASLISACPPWAARWGMPSTHRTTASFSPGCPLRQATRTGCTPRISRATRRSPAAS